MHQSPKQSPKCGLFPTVDKRHLQEGISQEQKSEIKKQSIGDIINNAGVIFFHMFFWAMFFFSLLFFGE
jgi:hypothetical protein